MRITHTLIFAVKPYTGPIKATDIIVDYKITDFLSPTKLMGMGMISQRMKEAPFEPDSVYQVRYWIEKTDVHARFQRLS